MAKLMQTNIFLFLIVLSWVYNLFFPGKLNQTTSYSDYFYVYVI